MGLRPHLHLRSVLHRVPPRLEGKEVALEIERHARWRPGGGRELTELCRDGRTREPQAVEDHFASGRELGDQRLVEAQQLRMQLDGRADAGASFPTGRFELQKFVEAALHIRPGPQHAFELDIFTFHHGALA